VTASFLPDREAEIRHFHLFCGLGGGARGFNAGRARVGQLVARFRCIGGVDVDAAAVRDFERLAGVRGTHLDLFDHAQYRAFHEQEPPDGWREATPDDIRKAAGGERPHIIFTSPPCKGFSGLLSQTRSTSARYQALNRLTIRGVRLALAAWGDDPPEFFLLENVPRIATRGRSLVDEIVDALEAAGYAVAETAHDCGELGGLAQSRRRFLLVARHREKVPPFLYQPPKRRLRGVGEVLGSLPLPSDPAAGPMHRMRELQWKTWVRLAFVEAGGDWRSLERLRVVDGRLAEYAIEPASEWHRGPHFSNVYRVVRWEDASPSVTTGGGPSSGGLAVADPRAPEGWNGHGKYRVTGFDEPAGAVIAASTTGNGAFAVADPRPGLRTDGDYQTAGHYGVVPWEGSSRAVTGTAGHDNGSFSVADPRVGGGEGGEVHTRRGEGPMDGGGVPSSLAALPASDARLVAVIRSLDNTWHRPFTTMELAALQSIFDVDLDGTSDSAWRERIGNAVPPDAAEAIACVMGHAILLAWAGETFVLSSSPIWVRPIAIAIAVDVPRLP
jgi:site-specific DNA-cytosine methylase